LLLSAAILVFPWSIRRFLYQYLMGYEIHSTARIGWSIVSVNRCVLKAHAAIWSFNCIRSLDYLELGEHAVIGEKNHVFGYQARGETQNAFFRHRLDRQSSFIMGAHSALTYSHLVDCSDAVTIGAFSTVAGFGSQLLSHSLDLSANIQDCRPITIGKYCFVGTDVVILPGAILPDRSVLGAKSLLQTAMERTDSLYGGVPAREIKEIDTSKGYFVRLNGFVD
jgi:acetyltransferase-like isoleucine patch superfamily enzyme